MTPEQKHLLTFIPPITDPMGKHWKQPKVEDILIDDTTAMMTQTTFNQLAEYSTSLPSGKYAGKMWKSRGTDGWYLRWYVQDLADVNGLYIPVRKIEILTRTP